MVRIKTPGDEAPFAPVTVSPAPRAPRRKQIERQGGTTVPVTRRWPQIRGGSCEFCGVLDKHVPSEVQYKLCPHYRGMEVRCSYCDPTKDPDEVNYHSTLNVAESPTDPDVLIVWCNQKACTDKHLKRFLVSNA